MKKLYSVVLLLASILTSSNLALADHALGSDITYECTSTPGIFLVKLVLYRDCNGIEFCYGGCGAACTRTIQIRGADPSCSGSNFGSATLSLVSVKDYDQKVNCPNSKSICNNMGCTTAGTFTPGGERYEFQGTVNIGPTSGIPTSCCNVRFVFEECCRSAAISTGATWQNFYIDATVNRCLSVSPCNSSPQFTTEPYDILCPGQPYIYNNGTIEPDGDSLTFEFTPALQAYGTSVTYTAPWAYNKPMPWIGNWNDPFPSGIRCDLHTGDIMFTPSNGAGSNFYGIVAIAVKQWKTVSGVPTLIGTTRRDIQLAIASNCPTNNAPILTTIPADSGASGLNPKLSWEVCEGSQLCFDVVSRDQDTISAAIWDTTYLQWDAALSSKGATFLPNYVDSMRKINGPREDSYQFCWTPTYGMASSIPYLMLIKNNDSKCPIPGRNARGFSIKVNPVPDGYISKTAQGCGAYQLSYTNNRPQFPTTVKWKIAKAPNDYTFASGVDSFATLTTPILNFYTPGKYLVRLDCSVASCSSFQYDTLVVDTFVHARAMNDTLICYGNSITLNTAAFYGTPPYTYRWFNSIKDTLLTPMNIPNYSSPTATGSPASTRTYTVQVRDLNGCRAYDSVQVVVSSYIENTLLTPATCNGLNSGSVLIQMTDTVMPFQYRINSGPYQSSNLFTGLVSGNYTVEVKDTNNCMTQASGLTLTQPTLLRDTLTSTLHETCNGYDNGELVTYAIGGTSPYRYSIDSVSFKRTGAFYDLTPATYTIHILDTNNCYLSVTRTVNAADSLYHITTAQSPSCFGKNNGEIRTQAVGGTPPYLYKFKLTGSYVSDSIFENLVAGTYDIRIKDNNSCSIFFTKTITQPTRVLSTSSVTNASCFGITDGTTTLHTSGGTKPYQYREGTTGVFLDDSVFTNLAAGSHKFYTLDNNACLDSITVTINQPLPTLATLVKEDPSCYQKTDGSIAVNVTQGKSPYVYSLNSGTFVTSNTFNNLDDNTYIVTVKDSNGCLANFNTTLVNPPLIVAGSISGNTTALQNITETYSITPQAGLSYVWGVEKGHIINGQYTNTVNVNWDSIGTGQIGVVIYSDSSCGDTATMAVNIGVNGLGESAKLIGLDIYPNPTTGLLNITMKTLPENRSLKLYDMHGRLIVEQELKLTQQLNMESLPQGIYLLQVGEIKGQIITR